MGESVKALHCECWEIPASGPLDTIHVFWLDVAEWAGHVTIICWGQAWTAYFGGMGGQTIKEFFGTCDVGYLVSKMGITPALKQSKKNDAYLARIIGAVKASLVVRQGEIAA